MFEEQVSWYETTLPLKERRRLGHFSTPPPLVAQILDACNYTPDNNLKSIHVLDPACGSGNFLAEVTRRLVSFATRTHLSQEELAALIQRNVWGLDPDPISCFLAEMQLSAISCSSTTSHIHQADGLALPWDHRPCIDLFLANPPYLAAKNTDLSAYQSAQRRGQADSYLLFLNLALQIVRPHGWLGLVLPDPLLARTNAAKERASLLKDFTIHHLWHLSDVFAAQVGAVVIIAQKTPPQSTHYISWVRGKWEKSLALDEGQVVPQSLFLRQPAAEFRYLLSSEQGATIERLRAYFDETPTSHRRLAPLSEFLSIHRGEELGSASSLLIHQNTAPSPGQAQGIAPTMTTPCVHGRGTSCGDPVRGTGNPGESAHPASLYPLLRGGRDMGPYATAFSGWWIARQVITKPIERYLSPKLLVVKSTDRLQAALDTHGHIALQTLYILHPLTKETSADDLYFFLALLNSHLLRKYVYILHTAYKWVQPQIEQHILARLPIPIATPNQKQQIINHAKQLEITINADLSHPSPIYQPTTVGADLSCPPPHCISDKRSIAYQLPQGGIAEREQLDKNAETSRNAFRVPIYRPLTPKQSTHPPPAHACSEPDPVVEWNQPMQSIYEEQERAICALYDVALF